MIRRKEIVILAGLALAFAALVFAALLLLGSATEQKKAVAWVEHTRDVLDKIHQLTAHVDEAENSLRGYILSGENSYLTLRQTNIAQAQTALGDLRRFTVDNSSQINFLNRMDDLLQQRIAISTNSIQARQSRGFEIAAQTAYMDQGRSLSDQINRLAAEMIAEENARLQERQTTQEQNIEGMKGFAVLLSLLALCVFMVLSILYLRASRSRREAEAALQQTNHELEMRVASRTAELETQSAELQLIFDTVPALIFYKDKQGRLLRANRELCRLLGLAPEQVIGKTDRDLGTPYAEQYARDEQEIIASGQAKRGIIEPLRSGSETRWLLTNKTPFRNHAGEIIGVIGFSVDITERRLATTRLEEAMGREQELRRKAEASEHRFRTLVEQSLIGIYVIQDNRMIYANPAMQDILGYSFEELTTQAITDFVLPEDRPLVEENVRKRITGEVQSMHYAIRMQRKNGSLAFVEVRGGRSELNGKPAILGTLLDITERKDAEEKILRLNQELEERVRERTAQLQDSNRELESFSYSVSHDLRAPLRHVQGYVEMLTHALDGKLEEKPKRFLKTISNAAVEMGRLIDSLLAFSRFGRVELARIPVSAKGLVDDSIGGLELEIKDRPILWKIGELPSVLGDPTTLRQVFANLIGNAVKYSRQRNPAEIEIGVAGEKNGRIVLFVRDNGAGFDMRYANKLFGVFQRLHPAEEFEGTGIGLATVRRILLRHGGEIWAESEVDKGSTFYFTLSTAPNSQKNVADSVAQMG